MGNPTTDTEPHEDPRPQCERTIGQMGVIGDMHTLALVSIDGTIDFMCWPDFDSPTIFASLLDDAARGGSFSMAVEGAPHRKQIYLPGTNLLLTRYARVEGSGEVIDFMALDKQGMGRRALVRKARTLHGSVTWRARCEPRPDYGRAEPAIARSEDGTQVTWRWGDEELRLRCNYPMVLDEQGGALCRVALGVEDEPLWMLLDGGPLEQSEDNQTSGREPHGEPMSQMASRWCEQTNAYWQRWTAQLSYRGRWRATVERSALALKLLMSSEDGSMIAAGTFGLPEAIGGQRNWDYRYVWLRDSAFALRTLRMLSCNEEANSFLKWIEGLCMNPESGPTADDSPLRLVYTRSGGEVPAEQSLEMSGYCGSTPVRIGNGARNQLQLDIYGALLDAISLFDEHGYSISVSLWERLRGLGDWVANNWQREDHSAWEIRGETRSYLSARVMCWVALDRAISLAKRRSLPADLECWRRERDAIYEVVHTKFWDEERGAYLQSPGRPHLDGFSLIMPFVGLISATEERWERHIEALESELCVEELVWRYAHEDGFDEPEGAFAICSFWYVENLTLMGHVERAHRLFECLISRLNHVGLCSEQFSSLGHQLGNAPQAFSHLSLVSAALRLDSRLSGGSL